MGKNSKRPKSYYINSAKRRKSNNELSANMAGFLCTCSKLEKDCVQEAYNLLHEFANPLYGEESSCKESPKEKSDTSSAEKEVDAPAHESDSDSDEDIESSLKTEIAALQTRASDPSKRRFQQVSVGVNKCVFISTTLPDPVQLSLSIMDSILKEGQVRTRNLVRMTPVQRTCKAFVDDIEKAARELVLDKFPPSGKTSFYVAFKARNNNGVHREALNKTLSAMICEHNLDAVADYKTPDVVLNVDVVKNVCCLGLLPKYFTTYAKYNLLMLGQSKKESGGESESKSGMGEGSDKEGSNSVVKENIEASNSVSKVNSDTQKTDDSVSVESSDANGVNGSAANVSSDQKETNGTAVSKDGDEELSNETIIKEGAKEGSNNARTEE